MKKNTDGTKLNIYVDMDGVLADFMAEPDGVKRFKYEKNFFLNLKPFAKNVQALRKALADGKHNIFILTQSPNYNADHCKRFWLHKYIPEMPDGNVIILRNCEKKIDYLKTADGILFDDYDKNINEWIAADGNRAVKVKADGDIEMGLQAIRFFKDKLLNA